MWKLDRLGRDLRHLVNSVHDLTERNVGLKVLTVDFDSQANLTTCFGVEAPNEIETNIADLMMLMMDEKELPEAALLRFFALQSRY